MDCCSQGSICFELDKGLPAAFVTLVIGGIAARITYQQYKVETLCRPIRVRASMHQRRVQRA